MTVKRFHAEVATAIGTGALGVAAIIGAGELGYGWSDHGPEAGYFPFYVGLILIAASIWNLVSAYLKHRQLGVSRADSDEIEEPFLDGEKVRRLGGFLGAMMVFVLATLWLGIYVGSAGYITYSAWRQGKYRLTTALLIGVGFAVALYVIFEVIFKIPLLKGPIENMLGIY